jgi:CRP-like cAMP-binding protein/membrane protein YdbS with pleckstrin-like domain
VEDRTGQLRRTPLFSALSDEGASRVAGLLRERSYHRRSTIYRQGELDTTFYIIVSGRLRVRLRDERGEERTLNYLQAGDSFGEHSLLTGEERDVTVDVEADAVLLYLEKRDFDKLLNQYPNLGEALGLHKLERLRKVPLFERLSTEDIQRIAALMGRTRHRQGAIICRQGESGTAFYVVESGRAEVWARSETGESRVVAGLREGDSFGARSLLRGEPRDNTVRALEDISLFYMNKGDFDRLLSEHPSVRQTLKAEAETRELMLTRRFPWQREDEVLVILSHRHIYSFVKRLWLPTFLLVALICALVLTVTLNQTGRYPYVSILLYITSAIIGVMASLLVLWFFLDWRNDYFAVTNKRVVHLEKTILIRETRNEAPLENIQDVLIVRPGIASQLLGFDDLSIQTAGASGSITFRTLQNGAWVRDKIFDLLNRIKAEERAEQREGIRHRLGLELGRVEHQIPPTAEPEEVAVVEETEETLLLDLLRRLRNYLVPRERLEENGVVTWRKHWIRLIDKLAAPALLLFILLQLGAAALMGLLPASGDCFWTAFLVGLLMGLFLLWYRYEDWRNDIYQLTDDRIIDIERLPLGLREERREASLDVIQDIGYEIPGIMANLVDSGNVVITTAAREALFTFDWVHHPRRVQEEIFARMDAFREKERQQERERRAVELLDWFATYTDLADEQGSPGDEGGQ